MAFGKAMAMMGGKPKGGDMSVKGKEKPTEHGTVEGEHEPHETQTLHQSGDGGYSTGDGEQHEHLGAALMHMAHKAEPDHKHMHIKHDGLSIHSHGVHESGEHHGPHEHGSTEELKDHVGSFFDGGEESEDGEDGHEEAEEPSMGGYGG
jgi:hypothetical protein